MKVDTHEDAPLFMMGCLSPSKEEAEPPTKMFDDTTAESPKCASLLAFSRDDDEEENNASAVGLVASGLAWVTRQKSPRAANNSGGSPKENLYNVRCPIEQQLKERLEHQKRLDRLTRKASMESPARGPLARIDTDLDNIDLQRSKSCPSSPSFMSRVYSNLTSSKTPLASNRSISNTNSTISHTNSNTTADTSSPPRTQLSPRLNPINTIYSFSPKKEPDEPAALGYFCQDEPMKKTNSPTRSTLSQVLARIGSGRDDIDLSEDNDSILEDDEEDDEDDIEGIAWIPPVRCVADDGGNNGILNPRQMHQIARHVLPKGIASCQWKRLYSLVRDGDSFEVCLHYAQRDARTLLVVRTTRGAILGGYAGETWHGGDGYFGRSDSCLFTFEEKTEACENVDPLNPPKTPERPSNKSAEAPPSPQSPPLLHRRTPNTKSLLDEDNYEASLPPIRVYRYTGVNRYIQYCDATKKRMAFGGGGDDFGLCIEEEFQSGSTGPCDTFDNEPLCDQQNFSIVDVELWGFLTGHF